MSTLTPLLTPTHAIPEAAHRWRLWAAIARAFSPNPDHTHAALRPNGEGVHVMTLVDARDEQPTRVEDILATVLSADSLALARRDLQDQPPGRTMRIAAHLATGAEKAHLQRGVAADVDMDPWSWADLRVVPAATALLVEGVRANGGPGPACPPDLAAGLFAVGGLLRATLEPPLAGRRRDQQTRAAMARCAEMFPSVSWAATLAVQPAPTLDALDARRNWVAAMITDPTLAGPPRAPAADAPTAPALPPAVALLGAVPPDIYAVFLERARVDANSCHPDPADRGRPAPLLDIAVASLVRQEGEPINRLRTNLAGNIRVLLSRGAQSAAAHELLAAARQRPLRTETPATRAHRTAIDSVWEAWSHPESLPKFGAGRPAPVPTAPAARQRTAPQP